MKKLLIILFVFGFLFANSDLIYKEKYIDPVHQAIRDIRNEKIKQNETQTKDILDNAYKLEKRTLFASVEGMEIPQSNDAFDVFFHFPPKHQGFTSSCWAHSGISFIECETERNYDKKIKLSVIFIVYHDFLDKAEHFVKTRGAEEIRRGSEIPGVFDIAEKYGLIPEADYSGNPTEMGYDFEPMQRELEAYLDWVKDHNFWDEETVLQSVKAILNQHLGVIPEEFTYQGKKYTCKSFYNKIVKFRLKDYVSLQSTLTFPFGEYAELPFPDHWWHGKDFLNLPLDKFYKLIIDALKAGITVPIAGDTSEPGYNRYAGIAFVPQADIAQENINQDSREYRIYNQTTGDDHAVHIVGYTQINGVDWFLIKDSSRSAFQSQHPGYYYYRGDYIKLKMLNAVVPK